MKNRAFTLIELLVVVLIIGILAAIAIPQYQTTVKVSRVRALLPIAKAAYEASEIFYLNHGEYTNDLNKLDIHLNYTDTSEIKSGNTIYTGYHTEWGILWINNAKATNSIKVQEVVVDFENYNNPKDEVQRYGRCYGNDKVCSKFGTEISISADKHSSGTNVYYMTI